MFRVFLHAGIALLVAPIAASQEEAASDSATRVFQAEDFNRFAPRTALDMVEQIPGFSFDNDDDGSRGFGQASGNVLINGQRISGKSNGASDALSRISAENVEKIEILDGASLDIPGLSGQVANVIAEASEDVSGSWSWRARWRETVRPFYDDVTIAVSGKTGNIAWSLGGEVNPRRFGNTGEESIFDATVTLIETREEKLTFVGDRPSVSGSLTWTPENGHVANLNASFGVWQPDTVEVSVRTPLDGSPQINRLFQRSEDEKNGEIGADYEFGLGTGRLKVIGLYRFENSPFRNRVFAAAIDGSTAEEFVFNQTIDEAESILRSEYAWSPRPGRDWQISLEGAFNSLESDSEEFEAFDFAELGPNLNTDPTAIVEELRGEALITHGRKLSDKWTAQIAIGGEISEITQSGADNSSQTFLIPKGFLSASYNASENLTLSGRIERRVGQLNFFDFIASSDINNDIGRDANPNLSPEQSWLLEFEAESNFGAWGAGTIKIFGEQFEDVVDRIPLFDDGGFVIGDAIGNINSATLYGAEFSTTLKFDPIGLKGVQVEASGMIEDSTLTDPLTDESRRLNDGFIYEWEVELRHDIPNTNWAWGLNAENERESKRVFLSEISESRDSHPSTFIFLEHKNIFGMTGFIRYENLLNRGDISERLFFEPDRTGAFDGREFREREFGTGLRIGLAGSF